MGQGLWSHWQLCSSHPRNAPGHQVSNLQVHQMICYWLLPPGQVCQLWSSRSEEVLSSKGISTIAMTQAFKKFSAALIKNPNRTVVTASNDPTTLHTWSNLQRNVTADGVTERLQEGGRNARWDVRYRVRVDAVHKVGDQESALILWERCITAVYSHRYSRNATQLNWLRTSWLGSLQPISRRMAQDRMRNYGDMGINRTRDSRARTFGGFLRRIQARLHRGRKTAHSLQYMAFLQ